MPVKTSYRMERGLRVYEIENETGEKLLLEETPDFALVFRRDGDRPLELSADFMRELLPLFEHFARYGNLPLPTTDLT